MQHEVRLLTDDQDMGYCRQCTFRKAMWTAIPECHVGVKSMSMLQHKVPLLRDIVIWGSPPAIAGPAQTPNRREGASIGHGNWPSAIIALLLSKPLSYSVGW